MALFLSLTLPSELAVFWYTFAGVVSITGSLLSQTLPCRWFFIQGPCVLELLPSLTCRPTKPFCCFCMVESRVIEMFFSFAFLFPVPFLLIFTCKCFLGRTSSSEPWLIRSLVCPWDCWLSESSSWGRSFFCTGLTWFDSMVWISWTSSWEIFSKTMGWATFLEKSFGFGLWLGSTTELGDCGVNSLFPNVGSHPERNQKISMVELKVPEWQHNKQYLKNEITSSPQIAKPGPIKLGAKILGEGKVTTLIPPGNLNLRLLHTQGSLPCRVTGPDKGPEPSVRPESTATPDNEQRWSVYPREPCGSLNVGTDLPTETKLSKVSSITSRYSVLSTGPSSRHSSWLKSTATSWKVTGSYNVIQVWYLSKGAEERPLGS